MKVEKRRLGVCSGCRAIYFVPPNTQQACPLRTRKQREFAFIDDNHRSYLSPLYTPLSVVSIDCPPSAEGGSVSPLPRKSNLRAQPYICLAVDERVDEPLRLHRTRLRCLRFRLGCRQHPLRRRRACLCRTRARVRSCARCPSRCRACTRGRFHARRRARAQR